MYSPALTQETVSEVESSFQRQVARTSREMDTRIKFSHTVLTFDDRFTAELLNRHNNFLQSYQETLSSA